MPGNNFILAAWDQQQKVFTDNLQVIRKAPSKKSVHDLRVAVKKMRSYLELAKECSGREYKEELVPLKRFFKVSGRYRDLQMSLASMRKEEDNELAYCCIHLRALLSITRKSLVTAASVFDESVLDQLRKYVSGCLEIYTNEEIRVQIGNLVAAKIAEIRKLCASLNENAHEIRKILKLIYYWLEAAAGVGPDSSSQRKKINAALDLLGKWQDQVVLETTIRKFRKDWLIRDTHGYEHVHKAEHKAKKEQEHLLEKLRPMLEGQHVFGA